MEWTESELEALYKEVYEECGMTYHICTTAALEALMAQLDQVVVDWDWNASIEKSIADGSYTIDQGDWDYEEYI